MLAAVDPTSSSVVAFVALVVAALAHFLQWHVQRRHHSRSDDNVTFQVTIDGMQTLLTAQEHRADALKLRIDELERDVERHGQQLRIAKQDAYEANSHAARCERDLQDAKRRISELEASR